MFVGRVLWHGRVLSVTRGEGGFVVGPGGLEIQPSEVVFLTPVRPTKIVCVGRNYAAHAKELGNPVPERPLLFLKPPSSLLASGGIIRLPGESSRVDYEGEIGVVMARSCSRLRKDDPMDYVMGVTPLLDITARDLQRKDVQFTRAKSFDTFCPLGPWIASTFDPAVLSVATFLNGKLVQDGKAAGMAFSIPALITYISNIMTLEANDVIATGTPPGVGQLKDGDTIGVEVAGVRLECTVEG